MELGKPSKYLEAVGAMLAAQRIQAGDKDVQEIYRRYGDDETVRKLLEASAKMAEAAKGLMPQELLEESAGDHASPVCFQFFLAYMRAEEGETPKVILEKFRKDGGKRLAENVLETEDLGEEAPAVAVLQSSLGDKQKCRLLSYLLDSRTAEVLCGTLEKAAAAVEPLMEEYRECYQAAARFFEQEGDCGARLLKRIHVEAAVTKCIPWLSGFRSASVIQYQDEEAGKLWCGLWFFSGDSPDGRRMDLEQTAEHLKLMGDPTKMRILKLLTEGRSYQTELAKKLELTVPTVNHHLSALLNKGFVEAAADKESKRVWFSLCRENLRNVLSEAGRHLGL